MTENMTLVQARVSEETSRQLDDDVAALGLRSRSDAVREGLRLLHRRATHTRLAREYDEFYGDGEAPISEATAIGDQVATLSMREDA